MAKKKKKLTREKMWFIVFVIFSLLLSILAALIASYAGGRFIPTLFAIVFIASLLVFSSGYLILSLPAVRGWVGEAIVGLSLKRLVKKYGGRLINNVIVLGKDGKTSQIDHVYVSPKGVFVIETKNYAGRIYGNDDQKQWTQVLVFGSTKKRLYNPVQQNRVHIRRLQEALGEQLDMFNVVVFVHGNIEFIDSDYVYSLGGLRNLIAEKDGIYSSERVTSIVSAIKAFKDKPASTTKQHIEGIKATKKTIDEGVCPRCGGKLVLRTAKKDGHQFYGCENFPRCRFNKQLEK